MAFAIFTGLLDATKESPALYKAACAALRLRCFAFGRLEVVEGESLMILREGVDVFVKNQKCHSVVVHASTRFDEHIAMDTLALSRALWPGPYSWVCLCYRRGILI